MFRVLPKPVADLATELGAFAKANALHSTVYTVFELHSGALFSDARKACFDLQPDPCSLVTAHACSHCSIPRGRPRSAAEGMPSTARRQAGATAGWWHCR